MRIQDLIVGVQDAIDGKRKWQKKWRAHMARVKALPQGYQIVYKEIQNYLFKVGPVELTDGTDFLSTV
jgi:DNA-binding ferritin-like protein (Dps family)